MLGLQQRQIVRGARLELLNTEADYISAINHLRTGTLRCHLMEFAQARGAVKYVQVDFAERMETEIVGNISG